MLMNDGASVNNVRATLALGLAGVALAYLGALKGPFVHDDHANLGPLLVPFSTSTEFFDLVLSNASGMLRRPISNATLLINFRLFGDSAFAMKAINLALHLLTGLLLYRLFRDVLTRLSQPEPRRLAAIGAIAWCAHPLLLSTVAYTVQRMTILSALFCTLAVTSFLSAYSQDAKRHNTWSTWVPVLGFYFWTVCAVLSKENGALAPVLAAAIWVVIPRPTTSLRALRISSAACVGAPILAGLIIAASAAPSLLDYGARDFTLVQRLATQAVVLLKYIALILLPNPNWMGLFWDAQRVYEPWSTEVVMSIIAWLLMGTLAWNARKKNPLATLAVLWFLAGHLMESSILPLEIAYEHRSYLPSMFVLLFIVATITKLAERFSIPRKRVELGLLSALLLLTATRATDWRSSQKFAEHEFNRAPTSLRANNAMLALAIEKQDANAALYFEQRTESLSGNAAWALGGRILLQCFRVPAPPPDFDVLTERSIAQIDDVKLMRLHQGVVKLALQGHCELLDRARYAAHLRELAKAADSRKLGMQAAEYHYQLASLAWFANDPSTARSELVWALRAAPKAVAPLEQLIFIDIQSGAFQKATANISVLNGAIRANSPWKIHRTAYWCDQLRRAATARSHVLDQAQLASAGCPH